MAVPNIAEIEEENQPMKLSPFAAEFHPVGDVSYEEGIHLCVFNDGVPSLVLASESDVSDLLHGIPDEALDENFSPSAEEAAELEAVEEFVEMMASLDYMEQREERARVSFDHVKKRWESRRAEGLIGRPKPAKHSVETVNHNQKGLKPSNETSIVKSDERHSHRMLMKHQKLHQKDLELRVKHGNNNKIKGVAKQRHAIQQPRKAN